MVRLQRLVDFPQGFPAVREHRQRDREIGCKRVGSLGQAAVNLGKALGIRRLVAKKSRRPDARLAVQRVDHESGIFRDRDR